MLFLLCKNLLEEFTDLNNCQYAVAARLRDNSNYVEGDDSESSSRKPYFINL